MIPYPLIAVGGLILFFALRALDKHHKSVGIVDSITHSPFVKYNQPQVIRGASKAVKIKDNVTSFEYSNTH